MILFSIAIRMLFNNIKNVLKKDMMKDLVNLFINKKNTLSNKQIDFINIIIFTIFFLLLCILTWGKLGDPFVDCGREVYLPLEILRGKVFIKDIFVLFNPCPLSFQLNAILYKLFGVKLSVIYMAGIVSSYLILLISYFITRTLFKPLTALSSVFLIMGFGVFITYVFNYIFTYSYATLYATLGLLIAVLFSIYAIKNRENSNFNLFMYLAFISMSFSIANKLDYFHIAFVILLIPILLKRFCFKSYFYYFLCLIIFPVISFSILFIQKLSIYDFLNYLQLGSKYLNSERLNSLFKHFFHLAPKAYFSILFCGSIIFSLSFSIYYKIAYFYYKNPLKIRNTILIGLFIILNAIGLSKLIMFYSEVYFYVHYILCWFTPISILFLFLYHILNFKYKNILNNTEDLISDFIIICAILSLLKTDFIIYLAIYDSYMVPLVVVSLFIIFLRYVPQTIKLIKNTEEWETSISIAFIIMALIFLISNIYYQLSFKGPVHSNKGVFYATNPKNKIINDTLEYIEKNVPKNAICLFLPEGTTINFLSDRKTLDKYYQLIPDHVETFGEDNIIRDLKINPPDYIFINNLKTPEKDKNYFCKDYAKKICNYVISNYHQEKFIKYDEYPMHNKILTMTEMKIYRLKSSKNK